MIDENNPENTDKKDDHSSYMPTNDDVKKTPEEELEELTEESVTPIVETSALRQNHTVLKERIQNFYGWPKK